MRALAKLALVSMLLVGAAIVVLIIINGRDPYGGPIEPSAPH
jgi:hypothetical protein